MAFFRRDDAGGGVAVIRFDRPPDAIHLDKRPTKHPSGTLEELFQRAQHRRRNASWRDGSKNG